MNMQDLSAHAAAGQVDELNVISIEGGIYLLEARMEGVAYPLRDVDGKTLHLRSVEHARQLLEALPPVPFFLIHASVYDEMCGLQETRQQPLRVPISMRSSWS